MSQQPEALRKLKGWNVVPQADVYLASVVDAELATLRAQVERLRVEADDHLADLKDAAEKVERLQAAGQVAAPAMVPLTDEQISEVYALVERDREDQRNWPFIRAAIAEFCRINGLTVGGSKAGRGA